MTESAKDLQQRSLIINLKKQKKYNDREVL